MSQEYGKIVVEVMDCRAKASQERKLGWRRHKLGENRRPKIRSSKNEEVKSLKWEKSSQRVANTNLRYEKWNSNK